MFDGMIGKIFPKGKLSVKVIRAPNNTTRYKFVKWLNSTLKGQSNVQA